MGEVGKKEKLVSLMKKRDLHMAWRLILEKKKEFMTNNEKLLLSKLKPAVRNFLKN